MSRKKSPNKTPHVIRIDDENWEQLKERADELSHVRKSIVTPSELVREAVSRYCEAVHRGHNLCS